MSEWQFPEKLDINRKHHCRIRLTDGREMEAYWSKCNNAIAWFCADNKARGLYDVVAFKLISSLPMGKGPNGECSDAELMADQFGGIDKVPAWISRTNAGAQK